MFSLIVRHIPISMYDFADVEAGNIKVVHREYGSYRLRFSTRQRVNARLKSVRGSRVLKVFEGAPHAVYGI